MVQSFGRSSIEKNLETILQQVDSQVWTIEDLFTLLKGKGYPFLIILFSLPFCQPIQIPGFSAPFGIVLAFIGLRMMFGHRIWWPQSILKKEISPQILRRVVKNSLRFFKFLQPLLHERLSWLCQKGLYRMHGGFVFIVGGFLALPLPIPFSNLLAAWALFLVALGIIEEDGGCVCIGYLLGFSELFFLLFLIDWLHQWWTI
ncbi:MAG: exopolysaccharide biosynthesis protein [Parachlamydiaceae bacterium]